MNVWKLGETYIRLVAGVSIKERNLCEGCCFIVNGRCSVDRYSELSLNECVRTIEVDGKRHSAIFKIVTLDECLELLEANKITVKVPELVEPFSLPDEQATESTDNEATEQATEQLTDDNNEGSYND